MEDTYRHKGLRRNLVRIVRGKGINDERVLDALMTVPRHVFFDNAFLEHAYQDKAFPIGEGQTISQPYTVAFQTEILQVAPGMKVLEIGTGSGYQACILAELGAQVYTIEYKKGLHEKAKKMLPAMGYSKIRFFYGDGSEGLATHAPFDRILVTAGAPVIPDKLVEQLAPGGILVIPVGDNDTQTMVRVIKGLDGSIKKEELDNFSFVPLLGKSGWKK